MVYFLTITRAGGPAHAIASAEIEEVECENKGFVDLKYVLTDDTDDDAPDNREGVVKMVNKKYGIWAEVAAVIRAELEKHGRAK